MVSLYRESVKIGYTTFTKGEVEQAVVHLGRDFKGINYHLINKNCNHFAGELSRLLSGREIPTYINRLGTKLLTPFNHFFTTGK